MDSFDFYVQAEVQVGERRVVLQLDTAQLSVREPGDLITAEILDVTPPSSE